MIDFPLIRAPGQSAENGLVFGFPPSMVHIPRLLSRGSGHEVPELQKTSHKNI